MLARLLHREGIKVGRRHVSTLMKRMGVHALYRKPNTSAKLAAHRISPCPLRNRKIDPANQVWALDTSYTADGARLRISEGFRGLGEPSGTGTPGGARWRAAMLPRRRRKRLRNTWLPEIVNTDQGSQFTATEFTNAVLSRSVLLSMDGKGAWRDNVFVERVWLGFRISRGRRSNNARRWITLTTWVGYRITEFRLVRLPPS